MKNKYILIFLAVLSAVFSCAKVDESQLEGDNSTVEKVEMTFKAVIEKEVDTKTVLDGNLGDELRKVLWQPGDAIGVSAEKTVVYWEDCISYVSKFNSNLTSRSESSEFTGGTEISTRYKAFYPYQPETLRDSSNIFIFSLPSEQRYVNGSFDPDAAPMVALADIGETFKFRNLCGILALQIKGEKSVKSIAFSGTDASNSSVYVAGNFRVDPYAEEPKAEFYNSGISSVTLNCETPVQLDPTAATAFYLVLPPATYEKFTIIIATEDGQVMVKQGTKPLTVKRSDVVAAGALTYVETLPIDLSEHGTANSYIVEGAGLYTFDVSVIGNGEYGIIEGATFHTDNPNITPSKVEILWQDRTGVISSLSYNKADKKVSFMASGREGNALFAAKDDNGNIIWSWHVWVTDMPIDQNYVNSKGRFTVMDRNLGAVRADRGADEDWQNARGLMYQWGRKDPFAFYRDPRGTAHWTLLFSTDGYNKVSIEEAISKPTVFMGLNTINWSVGDTPDLWNPTYKTIYDPCPVGYIMPTKDIWADFLTVMGEAYNYKYFNVSGSYNHGWSFIYDNQMNTTYYPSTTGIWNEGDVTYYEGESSLWSADESDDDPERAFLLVYGDNRVENYLAWYKTNAREVRCMKDEKHVDMAYPTVKIVDITDLSSEGATVNVQIASSGASTITDCGIIWGTTSGLTLENGNVIKENTSLDEFQIVLEGLTHSTKYYVRAYATNERGTGYSKEISFSTLFSGEAIDLSKDGTANCYIVPPVYSEYSFDASVKGNSDESVGEIADVEVLWETRNTSYNLSKGSVISSVSLEGNKVHFQLPFDAKPGNALIAVKDALGTILWSWHIWVVDYDPVETQQTYLGGAVMMDRNLGALKVKGDVTSHGLIYYWGRKDPFPSPVSHSEFATTAPANVINSIDQHNSYEYTIQNPTTVITYGGWNDSDTNWGISKTMYDPCPVGWQVPSLSVWDKISYSGSTIPEPYSTPEAYYPPTGYLNGSEITDFNNLSYVYSSSSSASNYAYIFRMPDWWSGPMDKDYGLAVRCMKSIAQTGSGNDYVVDDEFGWE